MLREAPYDALVSEDAKMLVGARYAVRNNQRRFAVCLAIAIDVVERNARTGCPITGGLGASGGLLLPLKNGCTC